MRLVFVTLFCISLSYSQINDSKAAYKFYQNGEYAKAVEIYNSILTNSNYHLYYNPYFHSLVYVEDYTTARKLVNKMIWKYSSSLVYLVDLYMIESKLEDNNAAATLRNIYKKRH